MSLQPDQRLEPLAADFARQPFPLRKKIPFTVFLRQIRQKSAATYVLEESSK